jgi:hypothetical protein
MNREYDYVALLPESRFRRHTSPLDRSHAHSEAYRTPLSHEAHTDTLLELAVNSRLPGRKWAHKS